MQLSDLVKKTAPQRPPRLLVHGIHGIGKTTFGANAPNPIIIQTEDGLTNIDAPHFPLATTLDEVWKYLELLINEKHDYKTVVVDTIDWLQTLIFNQVCEKQGVESIEAIGYAKGYIFALEHWRKFLDYTDTLRNKGMIILLLAHNEIKTFNPPDGEAYDRYQIKLHHKAATLIEEWADCVLFATFDIYIQGKDAKKAVNNDPDRVLYSANRPAWRAKTRYALPEKMPLDFPTLIEAIRANFRGKATSQQPTTQPQEKE